MKFQEYKYLVLSDLYRVAGRTSLSALIRHAFMSYSISSYRYNFWMRTCAYTRSKPLLKYSVYPVAKYIHYRLTFKMGILISPATSIGSGFYIGHFGGIFVNDRSVIGKNCNISQDVTLGQSNRGNKGCPTIGDNVYIGPGAKIVGKVKIGNNAVVGPNCVVVSDVPDNSVVFGIPGRVVLREGSAGYVNRTDYEDKLAFLKDGADRTPVSPC